jgi:hypothetical protein
MPFLNQLAPGLNAYTLEFDEVVLNDLRSAYLTIVAPGLDPTWLKGGESRSGRVGRDAFSYYVTSYGKSPLLWVSGNNLETHAVFRRFFDALDLVAEIRPLVDHHRDIVVYCGFFVIGNHADEPRWHLDHETGAQALTLLTPLFAPDPAHGGLLYYDQNSEVAKYRYRVGEAILFGDEFYHSTEAYPRTPNLRVLVSMTLGTDKLEYWPKLERVVGRQSEFLVLPCGHQRGTCDHVPR